ncbi:hypothetical protein DL991_05970 [Amycolatopsis sp. WAC 01375]|uniref:type II toxin-antitoxin system RelE family toxin n=1 Tax=Amycolatopsis sp. WAC 01375 TaxID=2203194 RepID=UPI000F78EC82|nr:type II toxin-antitoxin system RelE/ParE family toxin [Amycolatopsis sp. WAC 01375]RSM82413.1 hypothetical protein DL991_05970 [Amycolatopsis sp. WAC 01375]
MVQVAFTEAALDDLRRLGPDVVPEVLKKIMFLLDDPKAGYPLGGNLTGFRKLVVGRDHWRIGYRLDENGSVEICEIWRAGARSDAEVYAEATSRVAAAADESPEVQRLADVIAKLGRLAGDVVVEAEPQGEPVPDWLANRLIRTAGVSPEKVTALDLEQAVDLWTAFTIKPQP